MPPDVRCADPVDVLPPQVLSGVQEALPRVLDRTVGETDTTPAILAALADAGRADCVVTAGERDDLDAVADLLDLDPHEVGAELAGGAACRDAGVVGSGSIRRTRWRSPAR